VINDKKAKIIDNPRRFGTLKSLSFAIFISINATKIATKKSFAINIIRAIIGEYSNPKGKKSETKSDEKTTNFMAEALSIMAK
jgi:hypothetical protein